MFSREFLLLQQEAFLIRSCLSAGLTQLRKASLDEKGLFYAAFFNLSIGIERMAKTTLIMDHMRKSQMATPSVDDLKNLGHHLVDLLAACQDIGAGIGVAVDFGFPSCKVKQDIMSILNDFANSLRYYNLDTLAGERGNVDPLERWNLVIQHVITTDVPPRRVEKAQAGALVGHLTCGSPFFDNGAPGTSYRAASAST